MIWYFITQFLTIKPCMSPIFMPWRELVDYIMYGRADMVMSNTVGSADLWAEQSDLEVRQRGTSASRTLTRVFCQSWPKDQHFHLFLHSDESVLVTRRTVFQQSKCGDDFRAWWLMRQLLVDVGSRRYSASLRISRLCLKRNDFSLVWLSDHSCRLPHLQAKYRTEIIVQWVFLTVSQLLDIQISLTLYL